MGSAREPKGAPTGLPVALTLISIVVVRNCFEPGNSNRWSRGGAELRKKHFGAPFPDTGSGPNGSHIRYPQSNYAYI
jgi:hypothetical protein